MITLLTGTPGNGKTAHAIDLVFFQDSIWRDLDKYVNGVQDLQLPHFEFPSLRELKRPDYQVLSKLDSDVVSDDETTQDADPDEHAVWLSSSPKYSEFIEARATAKSSFELWYLWVTPGSVIFVDEAQRFMRPRPSGSRVPLYIQLLEYHRHFGVHFIFITQKERLIDSNVRMLCGQHIHITNNWRGRFTYEWSEVKDSDSNTEKKSAASNSYKLPKHVFGLYKSSTEHLKVEHKTPLIFKIMILAALSLPVIGFFAYKSFIKDKSSVLNINQPLAVSGIPAISGVFPAAVSGVVSVYTPVSGVSQLPVPTEEDFLPLVPGVPNSAPAFAQLRRVSVMPRVASCIQSASKCNCYTQQGSRVFDMAVEQCKSILSKGFGFNPYEDANQAVSLPSAPVSVPHDGTVVGTAVDSHSKAADYQKSQPVKPSDLVESGAIK